MDASPDTSRSSQPVCSQTSRRVGLVLLTLAVTASGCARLPRIDPSGDRFLIFPSQEPPAVAPLGQAVPGFDTPGGFASTLSNIAAPPAFASGQSSGPLGLGVFGTGGAVDRAVNGPVVVGPPAGVPQPGAPVAVTPGTQPPGPIRSRLTGCDLFSDRVRGDRVVITPQRVLAPVGTEVIVRAGVCGEDGYLRTNRRIDWLLAKQGAGEFVQVGEEGERDIGRFPWRTPGKLDNHYAVGFTSPFHTCLRRGNADPLDDIQVRKGDAWITVTSASEGTSYITAAAKSVENWDTRRASTTIYWVDAQWQFPPSVAVPTGQPHTLTTVVTRQSDGAPIAGWIVRYEVQDPNAARLGYDAGEASEVRTDNQGRASVELTPTDTAAGTTTVNITVIRPEQAGVAASPRIDVGRGSSTITWGAAADGATPAPVLPPIDSTPLDRTGTPDFQPPGPPPVTPPASGRPQLDVSLRQLTPDPIKEGDRVAFELLVQNRGTAAARNLLIRDRFDPGLAHDGDDLGRNEIETTAMRDLEPGESDRIELVFSVLQAGRRTHRATVSADGPPGQPRIEAFADAAFTAVSIAPAAPTLDVRFVRPTPVRATAGGEAVTFNGIVENTGSTPATNVVVRFRSDARDLRVVKRVPEQPASGESFRAYNEGAVQVFELTVPRLEPGQKTRELGFECVAERQSPRACVTLEATADGGGDQIAEACVEILPAPPTAPGPAGVGGGAGVPPLAAAAPLAVEITETANPTTVGRTLQINVVVANTGSTTLRNVQVQTLVPPQQLRVQPNSVSPTGFTPFQDGTITFAPIAELLPGAQTRVLLTVEAIGRGVGTVSATARSNQFPAGVTQTRNIQVNSRQ
ncbi:MAG: hypothetical protein AAF596_01790 [Planctomycetota bacterium]